MRPLRANRINAAATLQALIDGLFLNNLGGRQGRRLTRRLRVPACGSASSVKPPMLPRSLTKRPVNHARSQDVTEGYSSDWTVEQLREPAQWVAGRIDALANST